MLVVDASAWVEWLCRTPLGHRIDAHLGNEPLAVPDLTILEVLSSLRGLRNVLPKATLETALAVALELPAQVFPASELAPRAWALAHNLTIYDAIYVALAEGLDCPLLTCDAKLASGAASFSTAEIQLLR